MNERLMQFIWQFQYYDTHSIETCCGEKLEIIYPGKYNTHQGPDFLEARIKIGGRVWAGSVELHVQASDWQKHAHHIDLNYDNVVLHVVWNNDWMHPAIPTLVLENRVQKILLQQYLSWMNGRSFIPCQAQLHTVDELVWSGWKDRLLIERIQRKYAVILELLKCNGYHWEETYWWLLARSFGLSVNAEAFQDIACSIPYNVLARHSMQIHQVEALLLGQAGLLEKTMHDQYGILLKKEYAFLKHKYALQPVSLPLHFLRMRPHAFPSVRLVLLAMLVHQRRHRLSDILAISGLKEVRLLLNVTANDYWHYHYRPGEPSVYYPKRPGMLFTGGIIINAVVPMLFAYGKFHGNEQYIHRALQWFHEAEAEKNKITRQFEQAGISNKKACDSQALTELKNQYCEQRRCLECAIGHAILKRRL